MREHHSGPVSGEAKVLRPALRWLMKMHCTPPMACRRFIADSKGFLCLRDDVDHRTGCCSKGTQNSCETWVHARGWSVLRHSPCALRVQSPACPNPAPALTQSLY